MIQPQPSPATHESAFIERYERLYKSALILTKHNQDQAEDLLHDAFVQFSLSHPDLQSIQNLDGYLYRVLRNMRVSQMRRATRLQEATLVLSGTSLENILSLPDHSSLERGLNSVEQKAQEQVQDELRRICQYAVARKASSKAGSVVMLRFFLGYYPEEIAQILKSPRAVIDKALQRARGEARLYLAEPDSLSFIRGNPTSEPLGEVEPGKTLSEFLQNLRAAVYSSEQDACLSAKTIRGWYTTKPSASISGPNTKALSHVVSCPKCLDEINRTLGLPLLSTRHPADMGRRDPRKPRKGGKDGGGASGGTSGGDVRESFLDRSRKRLKEAFEHRPQELRICVNGFLLGSQRINAELNEQTLSIKGEDKVGFVEVFSEREVRLLFYCVESPPDGPVEHHQRVDLSAGRSLELSLDFSAESPNLEVLYRDPTLAVEGIAEAEELDSAYSAIDERAESKLSLLADLKLQSVSLWKRALERQSWLRPAPVTALVALTLVCALLIGRLVSLNPGVPSAADLLQRASLAETALESRTDQVLHRTINVEERRVAQTSVCDGCGDLIARRKIEIWQSAEKGITARRLYDEKNVLIAGDWRRSDGVQTLYHHGAKPQLQLAPEKRAAAPLAFADVWQLDPSAKAFSSLLANAGQARVEERENTYVISAESAESVDNSVRVSTASGSDRISTSLTKATLILSKTDLHPIEQTLFITQGDQTREYKFTETSFEQKAASAVSPVVFEPEPELLSSVKLETPNSKLETSSLSSSPLAATTGLEVHVLDLLHSVSADISEQLNVTRTADGRLLVEGLVESDSRKHEILAALSPVAHNPAISIKIQTIDEAARALARQKAATTPGTVDRIEVESGALAADSELRQYFAAKGGDTDAQIRQFASRAMSHSQAAVFQASALNRLANRFTAAQLATLDPAARAKWLGILKGYAAAVRRETAALRGELNPVFGGMSGGESEAVTSDADLIASARRLYDLAAANDRVIRSAFTLSSGAASVSAIKTAQFHRSLGSAESLAAAIERAR